MVIAGSSVKSDPDGYEAQLHQAGVGAVWFIPEEKHYVVFPDVPLPEKAGRVLIAVDDPMVRSLCRQILRFRGFDVRVDFNSETDLLVDLR